MARILHISADYPDVLASAKTRAISGLLELIPDHAHFVYSLNRIGWRAGIAAMRFADDGGEDHRAIAYGAPPKGIFHATFLKTLADWILEDIAQRALEIDLVHAHKLSVEGLVGAQIAEALGAPLMLSSQGNSDLKIIKAKRDLRARYRALWRDAAVVFPFAPWTQRGLEVALGSRTKPIMTLPCPTRSDRLIAPREIGPLVRSAFNFGGARNKNADGLIRGGARAFATAPGLEIDILGGGDPAAFAWMTREAAAAPFPVRFLGPSAPGGVQDVFNASGAFALVSHSESYGMVFAEALLAGAPCLIPRDRGPYGYFEEGGVVISADPGSDEEIGEGLARLVKEEKSFKRRLSALGENGGLALLRRDAIAQTYRTGVEGALMRKPGTTS